MNGGRGRGRTWIRARAHAQAPVGDETATPIELGKHGTSVNTYPATQVGKDGKMDADSGHDATQD
ncbi:hypothetical protein DVK44_20925 [Streptomyces paludis]|uniref:ATP-grasp-modified RiPP n=1 Tax=Streptomyces paludis TaxID=2282738 RepID=A0A345HSN0_9ACTN|nr:hypothetical protein DVK44_20925 [Streptomyces paludis]